MSQGAQSMALLMFISTVPITGIAAYTYRNRAKPGARGLLLCLVGMVGWSLMLLFVTWPERVFPVSLNVAGRFFFQLVVAFGWPLFIWEYLGRDPPALDHPAVVAGLGFAVVSLLVTLTNPWHHLVIRASTPPNPVGISEFVPGPWYFVHIGFAIVLAMLPIGLLLADYRDAHGIHRRQLVYLLAGWVVGFPGTLQTHLFRNIEAIPSYVDFTPVTFLLTALLWGFALYRHELFSLVPVSRRQAVERMPDPVITVDQDGTVIDANPAAKATFSPGRDLVGQSFDELARGYPELHASYRTDLEESTDVTLTANGEQRHFILSVTPVNRGASRAGSLLVFREVTALREREQDLELLKEIFTRLFRHNVRNRLNVLTGQLDAIERRDDGTHTAETEKIRAVSDQLLAHSEKATTLRQLVDADSQRERIDLASSARDQATRVLGDTGATVTMDITEEVVVRANPLVTEAIYELYENAIRHHHGDAEPRLLVSVYADGDEGVFVLEDDGPGIDESELEAVNQGSETSLTHGSGVGLWLVDLIVRKSVGSFTLDTRTDLGGTRATLRFARADGDDSA